MTTDDERLFIVGQIPDTVPGQPGEGREQQRIIDPRADPEQVYATPRWRREPTTDFDPRKGR